MDLAWHAPTLKRTGISGFNLLDGSAPRQLTHFTDGRSISDFAWSHYGKRLAIVRISTANDIILLRGLRPDP